MTWTDHLAIVPIVLPLLAGAAMLLLDERRNALKGLVSLIAGVGLLAAAIALVQRADSGVVQAYALGAWPAPFGIVLVVDRLSALMVLLAAVLGLCALVFSDRKSTRLNSSHVKISYA